MGNVIGESPYKWQIGSLVMKRFEIINGKCVIPEGIDYIEDYEFYCSDDLREVVFPESLSSIGREAFKGCWNLREIHLPAGVLEIEEAAFSGCCSLESWRRCRLP